MFAPLVRKLLGSKNDRELKRMGKVVVAINAQEEGLNALSDEQLKAKTGEFKQRLADGATLDQLLPESFAVVREAGKRVMGMRHFDVQLIGGMTLHEGKIAEMKTGEGKTLVATLPVYLNALAGKGVHVVTVNDYLASRDANTMRPLYEFLGMTVGVVVPFQDPQQKRAAYQCDITYGTNNELGFDYLRDNMAFRLEDKFQREPYFAVVDEVDSILIDEARTPLIISGPAEDSSQMYAAINKLIPLLKRGQAAEEGVEAVDGHYLIDEKARQVELTESGHQFIEDLLVREKLLNEGDSLYAAQNLGLLHHVNSALRAHTLFHRNVEYIVQNNQVLLVDEHTGRTMPGRRLSEGLHQAIEAKEGLQIQAESQTLASTTFQNYFRLYQKLAGMTGTADTEAFEFRQIYGLDVLVIPTNKPMVRKDYNDLVYLSIEEKFAAIVTDIKHCMEQGRPVLVGTASIESSEVVAQLLNREKVPHKVLNAKFHEKEAEIVAQAGRPGAVTIATNMAGRGTDIILGGNWEAEVAALENPTEQQIAQIKDEWQLRHQQVLEAGYAAATILSGGQCQRPDGILRIAFDGDAVLFSDESEQVFQRDGLAAFQASEQASAHQPLRGGPFKAFLAALNRIQTEFANEQCPIRTALVTARSAPAHERVIRTLREWNIRLDESLFLGGLDKSEFLQAFGADLFFDDQEGHCQRAVGVVPTGHVPHGISNLKSSSPV